MIKENQLIQNYNNQGITKNYPQYGTNFWASSPENNYGFGTSNIHNNIENREKQTEQSYGLGSENQTFGQENNNSTQWGLNNTPLEQNNNNNTLSGNLFGNNNLFNQNQSVWNKNQYQTQAPSRYNLKDLTDRLQQYQNNDLWNSNSTFNSGLNNSSIFSPNNMQSLNLNASSALYPQQNSFSTYSQPYQLAQNSLPNTASDVGNQILTKYKKLIDKHYNEIYKNEGNPNYVYLDPKYIKSIGRGKNIDNVNTFNQVNYKIKGTNDFANEKEKQKCYSNFEKWIKQHKKNPDDEHNFRASYFEDFCDLYIDPNEEKRLHNDHVVQDIPIIKNIIKNYDNLSYEKQLAILDMVYNLGTTKFNNQFTNFIKAANANSEKGMLAEYHRKDISESRNKWTADLLKK